MRPTRFASADATDYRFDPADVAFMAEAPGNPAAARPTEGDDDIDGTDRADRINGRGGNDRIDGEDGNDILRGAAGNDRLEGDDGDDILNGGRGDDRLRGGKGDDQLTGGAGSDLFRFDDDDNGRDMITDFSRRDTINFHVDRGDAGGPRSYDELRFAETGEGLIVTYGDDGGSILLSGVTMAQIDQSQFTFG